MIVEICGVDKQALSTPLVNTCIQIYLKLAFDNCIVKFYIANALKLKICPVVLMQI